MVKKTGIVRGKRRTSRDLGKEVTSLRKQVKGISSLKAALGRHGEWIWQNKQIRKTILNNVAELVVYQDKKHNIIWVNKVAAASVRATPQSLVGRRCFSVWHSRNKICKGCPADKALKTGRLQRAEITTPDGRVWLVQGHPVRDRKRTVVGVIELAQEITARRKAQEALEASEEDYQAIFNSVNDMIFVHDSLTGKPLDVNAKVVDTFGWKRKEFLHLRVQDWSYGKSPYSQKEALSLIRKAAKGTAQLFDWHCRRKDGSLFWVEVNLKKAVVGSSDVVLAVVRDISDRKAAEVAAHNSEIRYRELFAHINSGVAVYEATKDGKDFVFRDFNQAAERIEKMKRKKVLGRRVTEVFPGVKSLGLFDVFVRVFKTGIPKRLPVAFYKDNRIAGWRENFVYRLPSGEIVAVYNDLTKDKQAQDELRRREAELHSIFRVAPTGIGLISNRVFLEVNERVCEMTGYSRKELLGKNARMLYPSEEDYQYVGQEKYQQIKRYGTGTVETRWRRKDGTIIEVLLSSAPLDSKDLLAGVTFTALDVTERKKIEKIKDNLIRDVSHSLKTPIAMVEMAYNMCAEGAETMDMGRVKTSQRIAHSNIRKLQKDLNNILSLAVSGQIESKEGATAFSLRAMIDAIIKEHHQLINNKGLTVTVSVDPSLERIVTYQSEIENLLTNIIDNAIKFTARGVIRIQATRKARFIEIIVADSGCGIAPKDKEKIFDKFYRRHPAIPGTGLGLTICKEIVERLSGTIKVYSDGINKGTQVCVRFAKEGV